MIRALIALFTCFMILSIGGCKSKESIALEKKLDRQIQERATAWNKYNERINNLPTCEGGKWFDYCDTDFYLPDYRSIQVHIHSLNKDAQSYVRPVVKQALEKRGYNAWLGRNITEKEYLAVDDNFVDYSGLPPAPKPGAKSCKVDIPQYGEGSRRYKYYEVRHNKPLMDELLLNNPNGKDVDAVLFVKLSFVQDGTSQYWRVDSHLFDIEAQKLTLWNRACYHSGCGNGVKAMMKTKTGSSSSEVIGNQVHTSTAYWFEGNKQGLLSQAVDEMFEHLPKRVGDKVESRTISEKYQQDGCSTWDKDIMVFE